MKNTITLFIFALLLSSCAEKKPKYSINDYSTLEGLYSAEVESIIGLPDVVDDIDGYSKVYTYKQILITNFGKKCDLFLYFDGLNTGRFTNDIVGTIKTSSCEDTKELPESIVKEYESSSSTSKSKSSSTSTSSNKDASLEESKRVYNLGYDDGQMAYGLPASQRASAFEVHMAKGYNFSKLDYNIYVMGYKDGQYGRKRKY